MLPPVSASGCVIGGRLHHYQRQRTGKMLCRRSPDVTRTGDTTRSANVPTMEPVPQRPLPGGSTNIPTMESIPAPKPTPSGEASSNPRYSAVTAEVAMAKKIEVTGKAASAIKSAAISASGQQKSAAGVGLSQTKAPKKVTSQEAGEAASKTLRSVVP